MLGHYVGAASGARLGRPALNWSSSLFCALVDDELRTLEALLPDGAPAGGWLESIPVVWGGEGGQEGQQGPGRGVSLPHPA